MRTHRIHPLLALWAYGSAERELAARTAISTVRFELVQQDGRAFGLLDILFEDGPRHTVLPHVMVDLLSLARNDDRAFIYPRAASALLDDAAEAALALALLPQVRMLVRGRQAPFEAVIRCAPSARFDAARAAVEAGAAPLADVLERALPLLVAVRRAMGGGVAFHGADRALGSALAARLGVAVTDPSQPDWYGLVATPATAATVSVTDVYDPAGPPEQLVSTGDAAGARSIPVPVVRPLPIDVTFALSLLDGPVTQTRRRIVAAPPPASAPAPARETASLPGGDVIVIARPDLTAVPAADTDEIEEFATRARAAGVAVQVVVDGRARFGPGTLPLVWGRLDDAHVRDAAAAFAGADRRFVLVAAPEAPFPGWYEDGLRSIIAALDDERADELGRRFEAGQSDRPEIPAAPAVISFDLQGLERSLGERCFLALAGTDAIEVLRLRLELPAISGRSFSPLLGPEAPADLALLPFGDAPFVLVHAPDTPDAALAAVVLALADRGIPLVVATTPADPLALAPLRRLAGPHTVILTDPSPAELAALYAHATLFVDPAVRGRGLGRVVRAARAGAIPVVVAGTPAARLVPPESTARPSVVDLRDRIDGWWNHPGRAIWRERTRATFGATIGAERASAQAFRELYEAAQQFCAGR